MRNLYVFGVVSIVAGFLSALFALPADAAEPRGVIISELNWGGSGRSNADEWVELANPTGDSLDISGWVLSGVASNAGAITLAEGSSIAPASTLLISNYEQGEKSTLAIDPDLVTSAVSLANRALDILLVSPDGTVVDSVSDPGELEYGSSIAPYASMERDVTTLGWFSASTSVNLHDGQFGTPGVIGAPGTTHPSPPIEIASSVADGQEIGTEEDIETHVADGSTGEPASEPLGVGEEIVPTEEAEDPQQPSIDEPALIAEEVVATEEIPEESPVELVVVANEVSTQVADPVPEAPAEVVADIAIDPILEALPEHVVEETVLLDPAIDIAVFPEPEDGEVIEEFPILEPTIASTGNIRISEFVSSPSHGNEWIEIMNSDSKPIDLSGWSVRDASGKATTILQAVLQPGQYYVITNPLGKLNNTGDSIELLNASGATIDSVFYGTDDFAEPSAGESGVWYAGAWHITSLLTPGSTNVLPDPPPALDTALEEPEATPDIAYETDSPVTTTTNDHAATSSELHGTTASDTSTTASKIVSVVATAKPLTKTTPTKKTASTSRTTKKMPKSSSKTTATKAPIDVTQITTLDDGAFVRFTGQVIALPGTFGSQTAYLEGAALYLHSANWPKLAIGDTVEVIGTVSTSRGEKRIKLRSVEDLRVLGNGEVRSTSLTSLDGVAVPNLVTLEGTILARDGERLIVRVGAADITVTAHDKTNVTWSNVMSAMIRVTGILKHTSEGFLLLPRSMDDVAFVEQEPVPTNEPAANLRTAIPIEPIAGGGLLVSAASAIAYWFFRSRSLIPSLHV